MTEEKKQSLHPISRSLCRAYNILQQKGEVLFALEDIHVDKLDTMRKDRPCANTEIKRVVAQARADLSHKKVDNTLLRNLYTAYNPVPDVDEFINIALTRFPKLNCGLATVYLKHVIGKGEIVQGTYETHRHTFLRIDNFIIDITAGQYGGPEVYLGPLKNPWGAEAVQAGAWLT